ncbi:MAG: flavodoxin domain-containing protein [Anaerolineae bacterium]|jgi:menaquinone-dependent protoporphyrinogen oxidase
MSEKTKMTRRRFLMLAGGAAGAAALACCGLTGLAARQPAVEFIESSCGEENDVENKVLVSYASQCGSTGEVARAVGDVLCAAGAAVDVRRTEDVTDISGYRAVVVGSAVYMRRLMPEAVAFVEANRQALSQVPVAYFVVCGTLKEDTEENRRQATAFLAPLHQAVQPVDEGLFAGVMDYGKMSFLQQMITRVMGGVEGDFRDWGAIQGWAEGLPAMLLGE